MSRPGERQAATGHTLPLDVAVGLGQCLIERSAADVGAGACARAAKSSQGLRRPLEELRTERLRAAVLGALHRFEIYC